MKDDASSVVCPFYQKDAQNVIYCESLSEQPKSDARVFKQISDKRDWIKKFCKSDYKSCIFAKKIFEKY